MYKYTFAFQKYSIKSWWFGLVYEINNLEIFHGLFVSLSSQTRYHPCFCYCLRGTRNACTIENEKGLYGWPAWWACYSAKNSVTLLDTVPAKSLPIFCACCIKSFTVFIFLSHASLTLYIEKTNKRDYNDSNGVSPKNLNVFFWQKKCNNAANK